MCDSDTPQANAAQTRRAFQQSVKDERPMYWPLRTHEEQAELTRTLASHKSGEPTPAA